MLASLWQPSQATRYDWPTRLGERLFLTLAKRRVRRSNGKRAKYLCILPPTHDGVFYARDGRSYRWFPVLKNGYSSVIAALLHAHNCQSRYMNYAQRKSETLAKYHIPRQQVRIWGRKEWVQYPRPLAFEFMREAPFHPKPYADIRFCILRNPIERFISGWRSQLGVHHALRDSEPDLTLPYDQLWPLDEFVARIADGWTKAPWRKNIAQRKNGFAHDDHFWPQHHFLGTDAGYFTHIFTIQDLSKLAEILSDMVGRELSIPRLNTSDQVAMPKVSPALRKQIAKLYAQDYKIFGAYF